MATVARVNRTDISMLRPVERRSDGTIRVDAHLTRAGIFPYLQPDGSIRRELREPEEVFNPASLQSFEGVPVTNDHPPDMLTSKTARDFGVGSTLGTPTRDDDHVRGRLAVYDADTIAAMEAGKTQVSCGYTCDCVEGAGVHPMWGPYDAKQTNIRGNHVAIVDRARAGQTAAARMDGWMVVDEPQDSYQNTVAIFVPACDGSDMSANASPAAARIDLVVRTDAGKPSATAVVDPDDEASRNARGGNDAPKAPKRQPGAFADRSGDVVHGAVSSAAPDGDDDDGEEDDGMYDDDGNLTEAGASKIAASSFARPGKKQMPIHDSKSVRKAMKGFGDVEFDDADEKHGAFNRIMGKAKQFGISTDSFARAHAGKLDRADGARSDTMTAEQIKALEERAAKADKRKEKLVIAKAKIDSLEQEKSTLQAEVENLKRAAEAKPKTDAADAPRMDEVEIQKRVDAKVELLDKARQTGADVNSKMSDLEIKSATVKHVDKKDVPEAHKSDASYVTALFDGALERAKTDAADTARGAAALGAARQAIETAPAKRDDADDTDEDAAKARLRSASAQLWQGQSKKTKEIK